MPAPKGNKNALGHGKGAPLKYTKEWIEAEAKALLDWMKLSTSIYFKSFAIERGYSPQRFTEFAEKNVNFSEALSIAKDWQEGKLVNGGLMNVYNSSITKFVLSNCHGFQERQQLSGDKQNPLFDLVSNTDGESKELVSNDDAE